MRESAGKWDSLPRISLSAVHKDNIDIAVEQQERRKVWYNWSSGSAGKLIFDYVPLW